MVNEELTLDGKQCCCSIRPATPNRFVSTRLRDFLPAEWDASWPLHWPLTRAAAASDLCLETHDHVATTCRPFVETARSWSSAGMHVQVGTIYADAVELRSPMRTTSCSRSEEMPLPREVMQTSLQKALPKAYRERGTSSPLQRHPHGMANPFAKYRCLYCLVVLAGRRATPTTPRSGL